MDVLYALTPPHHPNFTFRDTPQSRIIKPKEAIPEISPESEKPGVINNIVPGLQPNMPGKPSTAAPPAPKLRAATSQDPPPQLNPLAQLLIDKLSFPSLTDKGQTVDVTVLCELMTQTSTAMPSKNTTSYFRARY